MTSVALLAGGALVAGLALQVVVLVVKGLRQTAQERNQYELATQRVKLEIAAAAQKLEQSKRERFGWKDYRKFEVVDKVLECAGVYSFYLRAHQGKDKELAPFKPGQYVTFRLKIPERDASLPPRTIVRLYSLSESPERCLANKYYRVTIKKVTKSDGGSGLASSYFADEVKVGDILDLKAPNGPFFLDVSRHTPAVLLSCGVGITPVLSMLNAIIDSGSKREVWFFHGARNGQEHIQREYLVNLAKKHPNVHVHTWYSRPDEKRDKLGVDYHHVGRLTVKEFQDLVSPSFDYYLCGTGQMMAEIREGLKAWKANNVYFEPFDGADLQQATPPPAADAAAGAAEAVEVEFAKSGVVCKWTPQYRSLLQLAEAHKVHIDAACTRGECGTCSVAIKSPSSGAVQYGAVQPGEPPAEGTCLVCVCTPSKGLKERLVLDA
jgi:ferredoxin-NADP reductase